MAGALYGPHSNALDSCYSNVLHDLFMALQSLPRQSPPTRFRIFGFLILFAALPGARAEAPARLPTRNIRPNYALSEARHAGLGLSGHHTVGRL